MSPSAVILLRQHAVRSTIPKPFSRSTHRHQSSSELENTLRKGLVNRKRVPKWDTLNPQTSYGLSKILSTYLPPSCQVRKPSNKFSKQDLNSYVPQGHHQVFFNDIHPENFLLPDGTDKAHYPGPPFEQRLWAGGSLTFNPKRACMMRYDTVGILQEDIDDVQLKGKAGQEKVFVTISRKIAMYSAINPRNEYLPNFPPDFRTLPGTDLENGKPGPLAMEEKKTLVFLRAKTEEERVESLESVPRTIKPIHKPDFSVSITPTAHLLSRFSALTSNAHRIHLDRQYCREVEGHRNLLVHGPLTQVLMLSVLRSRLDRTKGEMVLRFDYKNLGPLYVDEEMRVCVRRNPREPRKFDIWIEGSEGGYAVKATAEAGLEFEWRKVYSDKGWDEESAARIRERRRKRGINNLRGESDLELLSSSKNTEPEFDRTEAAPKDEEPIPWSTDYKVYSSSAAPPELYQRLGSDSSTTVAVKPIRPEMESGAEIISEDGPYPETPSELKRRPYSDPPVARSETMRLRVPSNPDPKPTSNDPSSPRNELAYHIDEPAINIRKVKPNSVFQAHLIRTWYTGPYDPYISVLEPREEMPLTPKPDAQQLSDLISVLRNHSPPAESPTEAQSEMDSLNLEILHSKTEQEDQGEISSTSEEEVQHLADLMDILRDQSPPATDPSEAQSEVEALKSEELQNKRDREDE